MVPFRPTCKCVISPSEEGNDLGAGERHAHENAVHILLVTADAVEGFRQHHLEEAPQRVDKQRLNARRGTGNSAILIAVHNCPALFFGMEPGQPD